MKKNLVFWVAICLIMTLTPILPVLAQSYYPPELKMRVLSESPFYKEAEVLIFYTLYETLPGRDSLDRASKRIIHFQSTPVYVDCLLDTVRVNSDFIEHESKILEAYWYPGKEILLTSQSEEIQKSYFGFLVNKTSRADTTRFYYRATSREVEISPKSDLPSTRQLDYWLIAAWIIFLYVTLDFVFEGPYGRALNKADPKSASWVDFLLITSFLVYIIICFIILVGQSRKIMLTFLIIIYVRHLIIKWIKLKKLAKT